jgi:hypothetical protein
LKTALSTAYLALNFGECEKWATQRADKAVDAAMVAIGTGVGTYVLTQLFSPLHDAFNAVINWLEIAAKSLF